MTLGRDWDSNALYELVRHVPSGDIYVIAPAGTIGITAIAGPLHHSDFTEAAKGNADLSDDDASWADDQEWEPYTAGLR